MDRLIGGVYRITEEIGHGSGGIVFKAYHERLKKYVVLKQLCITSNPLVNGRNEADLLKSLHHTYLPQVYDFVEDNGDIYTVIDFIDGKTLKDYQNEKPLPAKEVKRIALQLCDAVNYLHTRETPVIHSDIKPSNIMIRDNGDICLIDFNISLIFNGVSGAKGGTKGFAAPEQLAYLNDYGRTSSVSKSYSRRSTSSHSGVISAQTDIYSVGAVMYFMLTGMKPDEDYNSIVPLSEFSPKLQPELCAIVEKAMQLDPAKRYGSVSEMIEALNGTAELKSKRHRSKAIGAIITVACLAAAVGIGFLIKGKLESDFNSQSAQYNELILSADKAITDGDTDNAKSIIASAMQLIPERPEAYYEELYFRYKNRDYESCAGYITDDMLDFIHKAEFENKSNFYFYAARAYFELENYKESISKFELALDASPNKTEYYRDLAVSYAKEGNLKKAEETLVTAENMGAANNQILLAQGEIDEIQKENETALEKLFAAIEATDGSGNEDEYVVQRAVNDALEICRDKELFEERVDDLSKCVENKYITPYYKGAVYKHAAEVFMQNGAYEKAASYYEEASKHSELDLNSSINYVSLLRHQNNNEKALEVLDGLNGKYTDNEEYFKVPMYYAYIYREQQSGKMTGKALEYYEEALGYYEPYKASGKSDDNMERLIESMK